jgi:hypothetical protein
VWNSLSHPQSEIRNKKNVGFSLRNTNYQLTAAQIQTEENSKMAKHNLFIHLIIPGMFLLFAVSASAQMRNPTSQEIARARSTGPCRDPWVSIALTYSS